MGIAALNLSYGIARAFQPLLVQRKLPAQLDGKLGLLGLTCEGNPRPDANC